MHTCDICKRPFEGQTFGERVTDCQCFDCWMAEWTFWDEVNFDVYGPELLPLPSLPGMEQLGPKPQRLGLLGFAR